MNRRKFLGFFLISPIAIRTFFTSSAKADDLSLPMVEVGKGTATALNYQEDKKQIKDAKLKVEKMGVKFDQQTCANCMFYKTVGKKNGAEVGTCAIFPKQLVKSSAWCASWTKKA